MKLSDLDKHYVWHPFTPNDSWLDPAFEPVVIEHGKDSWLVDTEGRRYLDGNSSIWTNLHGHNRKELNDAIKGQLDRIAHSSFLGLSNTLAPRLAERLCRLSGMDRCFFTDDGSTAIETALKIAWQFFQQNGQEQRTEFISLNSAYHGDTVGAMSLAHSGIFHRYYRDLLFKTHALQPPFTYRSPLCEYHPQRGRSSVLDDRCLEVHLQELRNLIAKLGNRLAGLILEPRIQGAAGMIMHPHGYLEQAAAIVQDAGGLVILDEVMTGFGRTGTMFAYQKEKIRPDFIALAKGLTGGYLPLAATLLREDIFKGFCGERSKTFFHGHSYCGNQLGCASALASLDLLESVHNEEHRNRIASTLDRLSNSFWEHPNVGDVRQQGCILAVELVADFKSKEPFKFSDRIGWKVCECARNHGLLTRPIGNVLLLMPPYCSTDEELHQMADALTLSIQEVLN